MSTGKELTISDTADLPEHKLTINQLVGYNMAWYRKAAGLTQDELGKRLGGWTKVAVSSAERSWDGKRVRKFDGDELTTLARALDVPLIALFLPPEDAGTARRYVLDAPGFPDLTALLPDMASARGDSPSQTAYRQRLMTLGLTDQGDAIATVGETVKRDLARAEAMTEAAELLYPEPPGRTDGQASTNVAAAKEILLSAMETLARAASLERAAQERHRGGVMGSLIQEREELERRVDDLRAFEREYRSRLAAYFEQQLRELRGETDMDTAARVLALAQQTADQATMDARREANETLGRARREAHKILDKARREAGEIRARATPGPGA